MNVEHSKTTPGGLPREARLVELLQNALLRSSRRAATYALAPQWVCIRAPLAAIDPWAMLPAVLATGEPFGAWNDESCCLLTIGETVATSFSGTQRWRDAETYWAQLQQQTLVVDATESFVTTTGSSGARAKGDPPFAIVGFAYADSRHQPRRPPWQQWPDGRLVVPRISVWRRGNGGTSGDGDSCQVAVSLALADDANPADLAREFSTALAFVQRLADNCIVKTAFADPTRARPRTPQFVLLEDEQHWRGRVDNARDAVRQGAIAKVVLARAATLHSPSGTHFDCASTLMRLRATHASKTATYAFSLTKDQVFVGATPERLLSLSGSRVDTHAVAGTTARGVDAHDTADLGRDLLASNKNRVEHAAVVEHLRRELTPVCRALDIENEPRLIVLPRMQHLETRVTGYLRESGHALDLAARLHPTPAVCGWPMAAASAWLTQHEPLERGWYAGVVGYLTLGGDATMAVAIRSALLQEHVAHIYAGAGIVAESDAHAEWNETELKLTTMGDALAVARDHE